MSDLITTDLLGVEALRDSFATISLKVKLAETAGKQVDFGRFTSFANALCAISLEEIRAEISLKVEPEV